MTSRSNWRRASRRADRGQRRGRLDGDVRPGDQAEQPEDPPGVGVQRPVRQVEGPPYPGLLVAVDVQRGERGRRRAARRRSRRCSATGGGEVGGGHPQRQRQVGADPGQLGRRRRLGRHPIRPEDRGQQGVRLVRAEHVEGQAVGAVAGEQAGQPVPAGDQHQAAGAARQQRADLVGVDGVVQHHQHPPVGQQRPVPAGRRLHVDRDLFGRLAERTQQVRQRLHRAYRRVDGEAAQVDVQLPVREAVRGPGVAQCTASVVLPTPAMPAMAEMTTDVRRPPGPVRQQLVQPAEVVGPAGETRHVGG